MRKPAVVTLLALMLTGCGLSSAPSISLQAVSTAKVSTLGIPANKTEFVKAVSALGVKLTAAQLDTISANRIAKPNGTWAARPAASLTAAQNLDIHFKKHGKEFRPAIPSAQEYLAQAMALAEGKRGSVQYYFDLTSFSKGYQSNVVIWNASTTEMTALRPDGAMTTFYHNTNLQANRFVVVPIF